MTRDSRPSPAWDETQSGSVGEADRAAVRNAQSPNHDITRKETGSGQ